LEITHKRGISQKSLLLTVDDLENMTCGRSIKSLAKKPVKVLNFAPTYHSVLWKHGKQERNSVFDQEIRQNKKDCKLAPSHYF